MTLTSGTDTYADLAYANAYNDIRYKIQGDWDSLIDIEKESALRLAFVHINSMYKWKGVITSQTQPISWPRKGVIDLDGRTVDSTSIPSPIKDAQCELAIQWSLSDQLMPLASSLTMDDTLQARPVQIEKLGDLVRQYFKSQQLTWELIQGGMRRKVYPLVDAMLKPYAKNSIFDLGAEVVLF